MVSLTRRERLKQGILKAGEIAKKADVLTSTIRYYTKLGLLRTIGKTQGNYNLYNEKETLARLGDIKKLSKTKRLALEEIRKKLRK